MSGRNPRVGVCVREGVLNQAMCQGVTTELSQGMSSGHSLHAIHECGYALKQAIGNGYDILA